MSENEPTQDEQSETSDAETTDRDASTIDSDAAEDGHPDTESNRESKADSEEKSDEKAKRESVEEVDGEEESTEDATEDSETPSSELIERVEDGDAEPIAREIESLREQVDEQETTIADLESNVKRRQAEFQNYKKRMEKRRKQERKRATEDLVTRLIDVRDNLQRGLEQEGDIREGIETTFRQFDEILEQENVVEITPEPGGDVDPQRHEVLLRVESDQPADTIDAVHRPGYEMADTVIRAAQVTVSDRDEDDKEENEDEEEA